MSPKNPTKINTRISKYSAISHDENAPKGKFSGPVGHSVNFKKVELCGMDEQHGSTELDE